MDRAAQLRAFLEGTDVDCPSCGYGLRGTPGSTCPECGAILALAVEDAGLSRLTWWAAVLFAGAVWLSSVAVLFGQLRYFGSFSEWRVPVSYGEWEDLVLAVFNATVIVLTTPMLASLATHGRRLGTRRLKTILRFAACYAASLVAFEFYLVVRWLWI